MVGGLDEAVRVDLAGAQRRCGVGGEVRVARTGCEDNDVALLQMAHGTTTDVGLAHLVHLDSAHNTAGRVVALDGVLQGECVHDGGEHADVVGLSAVHATGGTGDAAEDVAPAHDDADLDALLVKGLDIASESIGDGGVDAVLALPHQRLTGQLQKNALVLVVSHGMPP